MNGGGGGGSRGPLVGQRPVLDANVAEVSQPQNSANALVEFQYFSDQRREISMRPDLYGKLP